MNLGRMTLFSASSKAGTSLLIFRLQATSVIQRQLQQPNTGQWPAMSSFVGCLLLGQARARGGGGRVRVVAYIAVRLMEALLNSGCPWNSLGLLYVTIPLFTLENQQSLAGRPVSGVDPGSPHEKHACYHGNKFLCSSVEHFIAYINIIPMSLFASSQHTPETQFSHYSEMPHKLSRWFSSKQHYPNDCSVWHFTPLIDTTTPSHGGTSLWTTGPSTEVWLQHTAADVITVGRIVKGKVR
jgi:hypothetical protein